MTDDNHEFTTESSPGEQAYERKVNETAAFIADILNNDKYEPVFIDPKGDSGTGGGQ